jgi:aminoglycoside 2'-N-acetyltransferase I
MGLNQGIGATHKLAPHPKTLGLSQFMKVTAKVSGLRENVDPEERDIVLGWFRQNRGNMPHLSEFTWTKDGAYRVVVYSGEEPVSFLKIIDRTGLVDERPTKIGGVAAVITPPEHRRKGHATLALQEAERTILQTVRAQLGLLLCVADLIPFYSRQRWQPVQCPVQFDQPSGKTVWPHCTMILPRPGEPWDPQSIDLCGLPW